MDVFIKSFNRPYYLERCLLSIENYIIGNPNIIILDDGTPPQYLNKIQKQFPEIIIHQSNLAAEKTEAIADHLSGKKSYQIKDIPVQLWTDQTGKASSVFLLLEEDAWITSTIDLEAMNDVMQQHNFVTLKLFWCKNENIVKGRKITVSETVEEIVPDLPIFNTGLANFFVCDRLSVRTILQKSGVLNPVFLLPYYALYTVSSSFYRKDYWLYLWQNSGSRVNENLQLVNALRWKESNPKSSYAKSRMQQINTSYITTSIYPFREVPFDFIRFNHYLSERWMHGDLNVMENFPGDFSENYLSQFLKNDVLPAAWKHWIAAFKGQFERIGCVIDS